MRKKLQVLFIEPFYADSHKQWLDQFVFYSSHEIKILTLPGKFWKWRMHGAAITLAKKALAMKGDFDLILCSSMLDVGNFAALVRKEMSNVPIAIYYHENQITYPWSPDDEDVDLKRDRHYGFINYTSALVADALFFNSKYHLKSFLGVLPDFLSAFPDYQNLESIQEIRAKSQVLPLGMDLDSLESTKKQYKNDVPHLLWNHRWEFDKNPNLFFESLFRLKKEGLKFKLIVLGKQYHRYPNIFDKAKAFLVSEIIHWGYAENKENYYRWLWRSDLLPVTSNQDFFGISVVEAIYCNTIPLLPNRLAYPEHVSEGAFFYNDDVEYYEKLKFQVKNFQTIAHPTLSVIKTYAWPNVIKTYDEKLFDLIGDSNT